MAVERKQDLLIGDTWDDLGVYVPVQKMYSGQDIKLKGCPECELLGKKLDYSLSVNPLKGVGKCHKCGTSFVLRSEEKKKSVTAEKFTPPSKTNITKLSPEGLKFFTDRMISQEAVNYHKIAERRGMVAFPYTMDGELVNIKYRGIHEKSFSQSGGGMHVMFNYDNAMNEVDAGSDYVAITEGEIDTMAFTTAGVLSVSVDSGAPNPNDNVDKKLECITNSFELFERVDRIYIAVDNDENGKRLQQELIRRFDFDKVRLVDFGQHKDANDFLRWEGKDKLKDLLRTAKELTLEGIYTLSDVESDIWDMYDNGLRKGVTTHFPTIDRGWKWRQGEVTIVTGYNNEGKTEVFNNLSLMKAVFDEWKFGVFSPENFPAGEWFESMIHSYIGKTLDKDVFHRATKEEVTKAMEFLSDKYYLVFPEEAPTIDELFKRFEFLVRRHGIRAIIIDPYNQIDHLILKNETIDLYVSRFMSMLKRFARTRDVAVILIAHQNPPKTRTQTGDYPEPDGYTIKNGGTLSDKADNVIAIHRPFRKSNESDPTVHFISLKIKKKKLVGIPDTYEIAYNWKANRFIDEKLGGRNPLEAPLSVDKSPEALNPNGNFRVTKEAWPEELF